MATIKEAATEFLATKRIAVTGVSRNAQGHGSNVVYQRLRDRHPMGLDVKLLLVGCAGSRHWPRRRGWAF